MIGGERCCAVFFTGNRPPKQTPALFLLVNGWRWWLCGARLGYNASSPLFLMAISIPARAGLTFFGVVVWITRCPLSISLIQGVLGYVGLLVSVITRTSGFRSSMTWWRPTQFPFSPLMLMVAILRLGSFGSCAGRSVVASPCCPVGGSMFGGRLWGVYVWVGLMLCFRALSKCRRVGEIPVLCLCVLLGLLWPGAPV